MKPEVKGWRCGPVPGTVQVVRRRGGGGVGRASFITTSLLFLFAHT